MQKHYNYLTIDLDKRIYNKLKAVQGDTKSRYILANLISNSTYYDLTDCQVKIYGVKKDKTVFFNNATITNAKQGQFEIELTNQALAVTGDLELQILILGSNQERLTSFSFFVEVAKTIISDEAIESTNEFNALVGAFNKLEEWNGYFEETSGQIEEKYTERLNKIETLKIQDEVEMSTETGHIVVEDTNNGQITDIKIEGNTLVVNSDNEVVQPGTEGATLKSVGDGVDKLDVVSYTPNLFDGILEEGKFDNDENTGLPIEANGIFRSKNKISVTKGFYHINTNSSDTNVRLFYYDTNDTYLYSELIPSNIYSLFEVKSDGFIRFHQAKLGMNGKVLITKKINNKQILFKNSSGLYEKPIIRSAKSASDTIEKHLDGEYYYHKKCVELVLNGSENWLAHTTLPSTSDKMFFILSVSGLPCEYNPSSVNVVNNVLPSVSRNDLALNKEGFAINQGSDSHYYSIGINKSRLSEQSVTGFKTWLQNNNITFTKQTTEEIYECVNIDLDCFEGDTSVICNSNIPPSNMSFKIASHISNTVEVMKDRISDTETKITEMLNSDMVQSLAQNGYKILPGGLILQWGAIDIKFDNTPNKEVYVYYPIAFSQKLQFTRSAIIVTRTQRVACTCTADTEYGMYINAFTTHNVNSGNTFRAAWFAIGM